MKPIFLSTALFIIIALTACKKDKEVPAPPEQEHRIAIKLNSDYLTAAKVDSALLLWDLNGQVQELKMQVSNDTLYTATKELREGTGQLTVQVFSKTQLRQKDLQWEKSKVITINPNKSISLAAPVNLDDPEWFPRVIHVDAFSKFTIIIALRPEDPYFFMKNVPAGFKIELERHYVNKPAGTIMIGGGLWKCNTVCTNAKGIIEDRTFFSQIPAQISGRKWEMVEMGVGLFGPNYSSGPGFYFNHY